MTPLENVAAKYQELEEAASPGPWGAHLNNVDSPDGWVLEAVYYPVTPAAVLGRDAARANARLAVLGRNHMGALLKDVLALLPRCGTGAGQREECHEIGVWEYRDYDGSEQVCDEHAHHKHFYIYGPKLRDDLVRIRDHLRAIDRDLAAMNADESAKGGTG